MFCASNVSGRKMLEEPAPHGTCPCCVAVSHWQGGCCGGAPAALGFCSSLAKRKAGHPPGATQLGRNTLVWTVVLVGGCAAACCLRTVTGQSLLLCSLPLYSSVLCWEVATREKVGSLLPRACLCANRAAEVGGYACQPKAWVSVQIPMFACSILAFPLSRKRTGCEVLK